MLVQEALCFIARSRLVHRDEIVFRHQLGDGLVRVVGEAHIAVGQDAAEPARLIRIGAALDDGDAGNLVVGHQAQRVGQGLVGMDRDRVHDHPGLELLDLADLGLLRWMTPRPPACAIAIASAPSVTVSIAAEISGMPSSISRVMRVRVSVSAGSTLEAAGTSMTSSNVSACWISIGPITRFVGWWPICSGSARPI